MPNEPTDRVCARKPRAPGQPLPGPAPLVLDSTSWVAQPTKLRRPAHTATLEMLRKEQAGTRVANHSASFASQYSFNTARTSSGSGSAPLQQGPQWPSGRAATKSGRKRWRMSRLAVPNLTPKRHST